MDDFIKALNSKPGSSFKAYCLLNNNTVGITPEFATLETLKLYLEDIKKSYVKVLKIEKTL